MKPNTPIAISSIERAPSTTRSSPSGVREQTIANALEEEFPTGECEFTYSLDYNSLEWNESSKGHQEFTIAARKQNMTLGQPMDVGQAMLRGSILHDGSVVMVPLDMQAVTRFQEMREVVSSSSDTFTRGERGRDADVVKRAVAFFPPAKRQAIAENAFSFFRGTSDLFWTRNGGSIPGGRVVIGNGDAHPANFSAARQADGVVRFFTNDFDEAHALPFTWDLARAGAGLVLAMRDQGLSPKAQQDAIAALIAGYCDEQAEAPTVIQELIAKAEANSLKPFAELITTPRPDLLERMRAAFPELDIKEVGEKNSGIASLGRERYLLLLGDGGVVELKERAPRTLDAHFSGLPDDIDAEEVDKRIGALRREVEGLSRPVTLGAKAFWLKAKNPNEKEQKLEKLDADGFSSYALAMGRVLATVHGGSKKKEVDGVAADLRTSIFAAADRVARDFKTFVSLT